MHTYVTLRCVLYIYIRTCRELAREKEREREKEAYLVYHNITSPQSRERKKEAYLVYHTITSLQSKKHLTLCSIFPYIPLCFWLHSPPPPVRSPWSFGPWGRCSTTHWPARRHPQTPGGGSGSASAAPSHWIRLKGRQSHRRFNIFQVKILENPTSIVVNRCIHSDNWCVFWSGYSHKSP